MTKLARHPKYAEAVKWVHCEANDWSKADFYCKELKKAKYGPGPVICDSNDDPKSGRLGVYTDEDVKLDWTKVLKADFETESICYAEDFISEEPAKLQRLFEDQSRFWREEEYVPDDPVFGVSKVKIVGKGLGGKKDDTVCAYCLAATRQVFMRDTVRWQPIADGFGIVI